VTLYAPQFHKVLSVPSSTLFPILRLAVVTPIITQTDNQMITTWRKRTSSRQHWGARERMQSRIEWKLGHIIQFQLMAIHVTVLIHGMSSSVHGPRHRFSLIHGLVARSVRSPLPAKVQPRNTKNYSCYKHWSIDIEIITHHPTLAEKAASSFLPCIVSTGSLCLTFPTPFGYICFTACLYHSSKSLSTSSLPTTMLFTHNPIISEGWFLLSPR